MSHRRAYIKIKLDDENHAGVPVSERIVATIAEGGYRNLEAKGACVADALQDLSELIRLRDLHFKSHLAWRRVYEQDKPDPT